VPLASNRGLVAHFFMRMYTVPPNMNEKEKVIGGIFNINQFFWVLGGLGLSAIVFSVMFSVIGGTGALVLAFPFLFTGLPFALYKKHDLTLFQLMTLRRKFKRKVKKLPNMKKEVSF